MAIETESDALYEARRRALYDRLVKGQSTPADEQSFFILEQGRRTQAAIDAIPLVMTRLMRERGCPAFQEPRDDPNYLRAWNMAKKAAPPVGLGGMGAALAFLIIKIAERL